MTIGLFSTGLFLLTCCGATLAIAGQIHEAAKQGDLETVKSTLQNDPSRLFAQDELGYTALNWAAMRGKWDVAEYLIETGADVNITGTDNCGLLHCACNHNRLDIIEKLIAYGANLHTESIFGNSPIHVAARLGLKDVASLLLAKGVDIDIASGDGLTPLHWARKAGWKDVSDMLTEAGASTTIKDNTGKTPLDYDFTRPAAIELETEKLKDYTGDFYFPGGFCIKTWIEDGHLWLQDYAHDKLYPTGVDTFYCEKEPWAVWFTRDADDRVSTIFLAFPKQTVSAEKDAKPDLSDRPKPRLGMQCTALSPDAVADADRAIIFPDPKADTVAARVNFVMEETPADKAGLRQNDVILTFNGTRVTTQEEIGSVLSETKPGASVPVEFLRDGEVIATTVVVN